MEPFDRNEFIGTARFQVVRRLGAGGMGVVYEALDRERQVHVALKTLRRWSPDAFMRFKNEFRVLQDIRHPNLANLGELLESGGEWFFTMELVEGVNFLDWVRGTDSQELIADVSSSRRSTDAHDDTSVDVARSPAPHATPTPTPLPPAPDGQPTSGTSSTVDIPKSAAAMAGEVTPARALPADENRLRRALAELAQGLSALHAAQRVHRDIKPSNVLVTIDGNVKILDFGLVTDLSSVAYRDDKIVGTIAYMAPEQAHTQHVGPAVDWYAVGVMLYQALTGQLPFTGKPERILVLKQAFDPPPPHALVPDVPVDLERLCVDLMHIEPSMRPSGREVLARLRVDEQAYDLALAHAPEAPTFVGRRAELGFLRQAFADARQSGAAVTVLLDGESGVGKSALVRHFVESVAPDGASSKARAFFGKCYERESVPYKAVDGLIDAIVRWLGSLPGPELAALLPRDVAGLAQVFPAFRRIVPTGAPRSPVAEADAQALRERTFAVLRELVVNIAARHPLVLVIDDLQWADADSLALLVELLRPPGAPSLVLVATVRAALESEGEGGESSNPSLRLPRAVSVRQLVEKLPGTVRQLHVESLPPDDARVLADLLVRSAAHDLAPADAARIADIAREAGGHPLFMDELIRSTVVSGSERPVRLEEALWARVAKLEAAARGLLELVTVAGAPVPQEVLARATGAEFALVSDEIERLRAARLVNTTGALRADTVETYHDRVRNAVLLHLGSEARRERHRRLARGFESLEGADPEVLYQHWTGAGESEKAGEHARRAGDAAAAALAFDRAARMYRAALDGLRLSGLERGRLEARLGDALMNAGRGAEAAEAYLAAAEAAESAHQALELRRRAADQLLRSGRIDEGLDVIRTVLGAAGMELHKSARGALASLLLRRAQVRLRGLGFSPREPAALSPEDLIRIDACWSVGAGLGLVDNVRGSYFQARGLLYALKSGDRFRIARAIATEAAFSSSAGGPSAARTAKLLAEAERIAKESGEPYAMAWVQATAGIAASLEGRWPDALARCTEAEQMLRERCTGVAWELATMQWWALWVRGYLGEIGELRARVPQRLVDAERRGDLYTVIGHSTGLANLVWLADDDADEARRRGEEAMARWSHKNFHVEHWWNLLGQAHVDLYRGDGAAALQRVEREWAGLKGSLLLMVQLTRSEALHLRARAALAAARNPSVDGKALRSRAAADARRIAGEKMPWSTPLARLVEAGVAGQAAQPERALQLFDEAARGLDAAGMALHAAASRHRRGTLLGGDEGRALVEQAAAWMAAQGIKRALPMVALLAP